MHFVAGVEPLLEAAWEVVGVEFAHHELLLLLFLLLFQVIWEELLDVFNDHSVGSWGDYRLFGFFPAALVVLGRSSYERGYLLIFIRELTG